MRGEASSEIVLPLAMNDRLGELRDSTGAVVIQLPAEETQISPDQKNFLEGFFGQVDDLKGHIQSIKSATAKIKELSQESEVEVKKKREKEISDEISKLIQNTNKIAVQAKGILKLMKDDTTKGKPSEQRIKNNLFTTLTRKFVSVTQDYQNEQNSYKTNIKKKVKRTVQIVMPDATQEEVDAVIESGSGAEQILTQAILHRPAAAIENAYNAIADKHQDVLRLEASIKELHQMFLDFALLVEQQGELLDRIQNQVEATYDNFEAGNKNIEKAIEHAKTARKWYCCLIATVIIIVVVIFAALGGLKKLGG